MTNSKSINREVETLIWQGQSDPLDALKVCRTAAEAVAFETRAAVNIGRAEGVSWERIGEALGISKQAAHKQFS